LRMAIGLIDCNIYSHKLAHKQDQPTLTTNKWIAPPRSSLFARQWACASLSSPILIRPSQLATALPPLPQPTNHPNPARLPPHAHPLEGQSSPGSQTAIFLPRKLSAAKATTLQTDPKKLVPATCDATVRNGNWCRAAVRARLGKLRGVTVTGTTHLLVPVPGI